jgi:hypothetical protein
LHVYYKIAAALPLISLRDLLFLMSKKSKQKNSPRGEKQLNPTSNVRNRRRSAILRAKCLDFFPLLAVRFFTPFFRYRGASARYATLSYAVLWIASLCSQ